MLIKKLNRINKTKTQQKSPLSKPQYVCSSSSIITNALKNGGDVMQLPNGDIIITEYKAVTSQYHWDARKNKFLKTQSGIRLNSLIKEAAEL